jgi:hypothetical protein
MIRHKETRLALAGVLLIVGGEAFCVLAPLRFERAVHLVCHAAFYCGIALVVVAAIRTYR